jgi:hypothetical protein
MSFPPVRTKQRYIRSVDLGSQNAIPTDVSHEFIRLDDHNCTHVQYVEGLSSAAFDVAVHPMIMDAECESYLVISTDQRASDRSGRRYEHAPENLHRCFPTEVWYCVGAVAIAFMMSAVMMEWSRARFNHIAYTVLSLTANMHTPDCITEARTYFTQTWSFSLP